MCIRDSSGPGDLNGDGHDDLLIGAGGESTYVFYGPVTADVTLYDADHVLYETESATWSNSGGALIGMGDQDGDGHAEYIVGASHNSTEEHWAGAVYPINGDALTESGSVQYRDELASAVLHGTTQYGYVGFSVADAGDVNGDGEADLLTGTANMEMPSHLVYGPLSGSLSADVIFSPETSNSSGQEVSSAPVSYTHLTLPTSG